MKITSILLIIFGIVGLFLLFLNPVKEIINSSFFHVGPHAEIREKDLSLAIQSFSILFILVSVLTVINYFIPKKCFGTQLFQVIFNKIATNDFYTFVLLLILIFVIYHRTFQIGFYQDDYAWLLDSMTSSIDIRHIFSTAQSHFFRPFTHLYHLMNFILFGENAALYHISGLFFHSVSAFLLYKIASILFEDKRISLMASLIFCCYYVSHKNVIWIAGTEIIFAGFLYLLSIFNYLLYLKQGKKLNFWISLISLVIGILAKEAVISLVPMIFILHITYERKKQRPTWIYFMIIGVGYLIFQYLLQSNSFLVTGNVYQLNPIVIYRNYIQYLFSAITPEGYNLFNIYPGLVNYIQWIVIGVVLAIFIKGSRLTRILMIWFLFMLLPLMPFDVPVQPRYLYLPSMPLSLLLAVFLFNGYQKHFSFTENGKRLMALILFLFFGANVLLTNFGISIMLRKQQEASAYVNRVLENEDVIEEVKLGNLPEDSPISYDHLIGVIQYEELKQKEMSGD